MKIGILTYHSACNFGANLQALSTVEFIQSQGHTPIIIDWYPKSLENSYKSKTPLKQMNCHDAFRNKYFTMTMRCFSSKDVAKAIDDNDIQGVIVGSDAVVQHYPFLSRLVFPTRSIISLTSPNEDRMFPNPFWGSFFPFLKERVPMVMMSVSNQSAPYKTMVKKERENIYESLKRFSYISVRDNWTQNMVKYVSHNEIIPPITPDPVFAFNHNVKSIPTKEEICKRFSLSDKYALISFHNLNTVSSQWIKELSDSFNRRGIESVALPYPQGIETEHPVNKLINVPLDPLDWYALLKYADAYVGHNMHPIVVCLSNSVPCFSFDHYGNVKFRVFVNEKSSKIYHIMKRFGIPQNRVNCAGKWHKVPEAEFVMSLLDTFDKNAISKVAEDYVRDYLKMMSDIMQTLTSK